MSYISRRAGEEIKRTVQIVRQLSQLGGDDRPDQPILLAKLQEPIDADATGGVKLMTGDKGSEVIYGDEFDVYNRFADLDIGAEVLIRWIDQGWEILGSSRPTTDVVTGCGDCTIVASTLPVDLGEGQPDAAAEYRASPLCNDSLSGTFTDATEDGESGEIVWTFTAADLSLSCLGDTVTFTGELRFSMSEPGGLVATFTGDDSSVTVFKNPIAWDPGANLLMFRTSFTQGCKCNPFESFLCLAPVDV